MEVIFIQDGKEVLHRKNLDFSTIDFFERFLCDFHYHFYRLGYSRHFCYIYFYSDYNVSIAIDEFLRYCRNTSYDKIESLPIRNKEVSEDILSRVRPIIENDDL